MGVVSRRTGPPAGNPANPDSREGRGLKIKVARVNLGSRCSGVCVWGSGGRGASLQACFPILYS